MPGRSSSYKHKQGCDLQTQHKAVILGFLSLVWSLVIDILLAGQENQRAHDANPESIWGLSINIVILNKLFKSYLYMKALLHLLINYQSEVLCPFLFCLFPFFVLICVCFSWGPWGMGVGFPATHLRPWNVLHQLSLLCLSGGTHTDTCMHTLLPSLLLPF